MPNIFGTVLIKRIPKGIHPTTITISLNLIRLYSPHIGFSISIFFTYMDCQMPLRRIQMWLR